MTKKLHPVTEEDISVNEGSPSNAKINALHEIVTTMVPGLPGEVLYEQIRELHELGYKNPAQKVIKMNIAIGLWNNSVPKNEEEIRMVFGIVSR